MSKTPTDATSPADEHEVDASLTPTEARTDEKAAQTEQARIESDSGLSPVVEQQGGAALANLGKRRGGDLFRE